MPETVDPSPDPPWITLTDLIAASEAVLRAHETMERYLKPKRTRKKTLFCIVRKDDKFQIKGYHSLKSALRHEPKGTYVNYATPGDMVRAKFHGRKVPEGVLYSKLGKVDAETITRTRRPRRRREGSITTDRVPQPSRTIRPEDVRIIPVDDQEQLSWTVEMPNSREFLNFWGRGDTTPSRIITGRAVSAYIRDGHEWAVAPGLNHPEEDIPF